MPLVSRGWEDVLDRHQVVAKDERQAPTSTGGGLPDSADDAEVGVPSAGLEQNQRSRRHRWRDRRFARDCATERAKSASLMLGTRTSRRLRLWGRAGARRRPGRDWLSLRRRGWLSSTHASASAVGASPCGARFCFEETRRTDHGVWSAQAKSECVALGPSAIARQVSVVGEPSSKATRPSLRRIRTARVRRRVD